MSLNDLRKEIDEIDEQLVALLNRRAAIAQKVGQSKAHSRAHYFTPEREETVYKRVCELNNGPFTPRAIKAIYREIISASLALEKPLNIAYLGPEGTFSHQASLMKFGSSSNYIPVDSIQDIFKCVEREQCDYGLAPIENSQAGVIPETLDTFVTSNLRIVSELFVPITENLASYCQKLEDIKKVYSHPQPIAQCRQWLRNHLPGVELVETSSTSRAAEQASREHSAAAIGPELAAEKYGVPILVRHIEDNPGNRTRFIVLGYNEPDRTGNDKTSIMFSVKHKSGELYHAMGAFEKYDVNLTMIESRPARSTSWEYMFYVDVQGHLKDADVMKALNLLNEHALYVRILGAYPAAE
jgi:chorismate mutase/prephenate dehydratase